MNIVADPVNGRVPLLIGQKDFDGIFQQTMPDFVESALHPSPDAFKADKSTPDAAAAASNAVVNASQTLM